MGTIDIRFSNFDPEEFLREYWQKRPLLIRNPWPRWRNPVEPDELAGLACEDYVDSRLVTGSTEVGDALGLEHGPLPDDRLDALGAKPWTLLVQAVDHHIPAVADLIDPFRFIPNWRIDDVMVSYATDQGGVGAHYDQYDVFLVQGLGRRRWELGDICSEETPLLPHEDLRLLAEFEARQDWVLEPGDILYVPPGLAHKGTAIGHDCMTYSVGFRAPSRTELVAGWTDEVLDQLTDDDRYVDADLKLQANPGLISEHALSRLHKMVMEKLGDEAAFARWIGKFATAPKGAALDWQPEHTLSDEQVLPRFACDAILVRNPASRFAYVRWADGNVLLSVDGESYECCDETGAFAEKLCANTRIPVDPSETTARPVRALILALVNRGSIAFDGDEG